MVHVHSCALNEIRFIRCVGEGKWFRVLSEDLDSRFSIGERRDEVLYCSPLLVSKRRVGSEQQQAFHDGAVIVGGCDPQRADSFPVRLIEGPALVDEEENDIEGASRSRGPQRAPSVVVAETEESVVGRCPQKGLDGSPSPHRGCQVEGAFT